MPLLLAPAAQAAPAAAAADVTSAAEARRVDRVPTPKLDWFRCYNLGECATVKVPLDYDQPRGATVELAVARVKAANPSTRIGTLFVNPGGPGGSAVEFALFASQWLSQAVRDRFDIVGVDPRGIAYSQNVKCFRSNQEQDEAVGTVNTLAFPWTKDEEASYVAGSKALGKACATTGQPLASAMSTAEVARDMDVMRRAVGDKKLTYLGFSYGTQLGQVYANLFPDRVRALAIDGVLDPTAWAGTKANANTPVTDRILSGDGAWKAFDEFLARCEKAGDTACRFAAGGEPAAKWKQLTDVLKGSPVVVQDPENPDFVYTITYADTVLIALIIMYDPFLGDELGSFLQDTYTAVAPAAGAKVTGQQRLAAVQKLKKQLADLKAANRRTNPAFEFPYFNGLEAFNAVLCSDSLNPPRAEQWPAFGVASDARAPYFGRAWLWSSSPCASSTWRAVDEDAYRGPFTKRTSAPVLVVGNFYDPATNYRNAVAVSKLLPNSRLLSSDSWGHTAYGTSSCATTTVDSYLIQLALPKAGTLCVGPQPFDNAAAKPSQQRSAAAGVGSPVPVTPFIPPAALQLLK